MTTRADHPAGPAAGRWTVFLPSRADVPKDLFSGVTVALVSVAEGIAYAIVAGVDPIYGLYAGSISVIVGSLFASSSLLLITATNALALVTADKLGALGGDVDTTTAMFTLTLLVGVVMATLGLLRLGSVVRFISAEIQAGLVAAVALLILLGQYKDLVGYSSKKDGNKVVKAIDITAHIGQWKWQTLAVGLTCIVVLIVVKRTALRSFADVFALVLGTLMVSVLGLDSVETIGDQSKIPAGLSSIPTPHLPDLSLVPALIPAAIAAAIVGLSEAATVGAAFPNPDGSKSDTSRDFLAQGAANIAGGFFRALPSGGSLSRTGVNVSAGARSRWSGVFAGILLILVIAVAAPLAELIPLATLAAILIVIGFETLLKEVRHLLEARWVSRPHLAAGVVTVLVGVFDELTTAIFVGVALSLLLFTLTMAGRSTPVALERTDAGAWKEVKPPARLEPGTVTVLNMEGSMYFASTYKADAVLPDHESTSGAVLVVNIRNRHFYSLSGVDYVAEFARSVLDHGHLILFTDVEPTERQALERTGLLAELGPDNVIWRRDVIGEAAQLGLQRGNAWLVDQRQAGTATSATDPPKEEP